MVVGNLALDRTSTAVRSNFGGFGAFLGGGGRSLSLSASLPAGTSTSLYSASYPDVIPAFLL
jgi:hypothetical protein